MPLLTRLLVDRPFSWLYTTALNTSVQNFSALHRGKVVGLLACCFGLCAGIFTRLQAGFYPESTASNSGDVAPFLLFLALTTGAIGVAGTLCQQLLFKGTGLQPPPTETRRIAIGMEHEYAAHCAMIFSHLSVQRLPSPSASRSTLEARP
jgi:hypothetical protein